RTNTKPLMSSSRSSISRPLMVQPPLASRPYRPCMSDSAVAPPCRRDLLVGIASDASCRQLRRDEFAVDGFHLRHRWVGLDEYRRRNGAEGRDGRQDVEGDREAVRQRCAAERRGARVNVDVMSW